MAYRSSSVLSSGNFASVVVPVPTGAATGDIAVVGIYLEGATTVTPATGFALQVDLPTNPTTAGRIAVYWKRLTANDTGTYTFALSATTYVGADCALFSGRASSGNPFDVAPGTIEGSTASTTSVNPGCTTVHSGVDLVGFASNFASSSGAWSGPTGMTGRQTASVNELALFTQDNLTTTGATGSQTFTYTISGLMKSVLGALTPNLLSTYNPSISDSVGVTDAVSRTSNLTTTPADSVGIQDTNNPFSIDFGSSAADQVGITDQSSSAAIVNVPSTTDSTGLTDNVSSSVGFGRTLTESFGITDSASGALIPSNYNGFGSGAPAATFAGDSNEGVFSTAFSTSLTNQIAVAARIYVSPSATGVLTGAYGYLFASDPVSGYPATGTPLAISAPTNLVVGWNDISFNAPYALVPNTIYYVGVYNKGNIYSYISHEFDSDLPAPSGASGLTFTAGTATHQNGAYVYSGPGGIPANSFGNTWYGVDVALSTGGSNLSASSNDSLGLTDQSSTTVAANPAQIDSTGLTDLTSTNVAAARSQDDSVGLSDFISYVMNSLVTQTSADQLGLLDSVSFVITSSRQVTDSLGVTDIANPALTVGGSTGSTTANENAGISDLALPQVSATRQSDDPVGLTDAIAVSTGFNKPLGESFGLSDAVTFVQTISVTISDALGAIDASISNSAFARAIDDQIGAIDLSSPHEIVPMAFQYPIDEAMGIEDAIMVEISFNRWRDYTAGPLIPRGLTD